MEVLKSSMRTREYIMKGESEGRSLTDAMHDGQVDGMQTFDDELEKLWSESVISRETALVNATNPTNLALRLTEEDKPAATEAEKSDDEMMSLLE